MKTMTAAAAFATSFALLASVPEVSTVTMTQDDTRLVTITYELADTPAVVTLDVQTNAGENAWVSIGGEAVRNAQGDVWKQVAAGTRTISWRPDLSWPDHKIANGGARAVVTAWALDNTPDYMVVYLTATGGAETQKYYPAVDFLPGGLFSNDIYRTTAIVMRKIMASGVEWTMGSMGKEPGHASNEEVHNVTLSNNYYIGVFEITQAQFSQIYGSNPSCFTNAEVWAMRPVEKVSYDAIRGKGEDYYWPKPPAGSSFLGLLRAKTGIDSFDLPSEAQWEFACRAGHGSPFWGDGSAVNSAKGDSNLVRLGRFSYNGGWVNGNKPTDYCGAENGPAVVGTYEPNSWGLYDMHGNVWEWCLDWYADDIAGDGGEVNDEPGTKRVYRGGSWYYQASYCRSAARYGCDTWYGDFSMGFRVVCTAGLR